MTHWRTLLERMLAGLDALDALGFALEDWTLGGGTALMIATEHRISRDVDVFINSPEYLPYLSPRLGGEAVWTCDAYEEAANFLKLRFPEGEIDFIVARAITPLPPRRVPIDLAGGGSAAEALIPLEHPVEIALKKLFFRGPSLLVRDAFDICVVDSLVSDELHAHLHLVAGRKRAIQTSVGRLSPDFVKRSLGELDILPAWAEMAATTHERILSIIDSIPDEPLGTTAA
ncbi:MAG: nucleotidyl transferase AbiEii/AbiGii toxin family protein [Salinarimonas sp.]